MKGMIHRRPGAVQHRPRRNFGGLRFCGWPACRMRIIRRRVRGRHGKRRSVGKADKRERWLRRQQQWRRKAMPDYAGDAFEVACRDPIVGIGRASLIDRTADRRHQFIRLAGIRRHCNCRKRGLKNQRKRGEPDDCETDGAENIGAAEYVPNKCGSVFEQAPETCPLTRRPAHPFPGELTLVTPRLQVCPLPSPMSAYLVNHGLTFTAMRRLDAVPWWTLMWRSRKGRGDEPG